MTATQRPRDSFLVKHDADGVAWTAPIVWKNAIGFLLMHLIACYGLYLAVVSAQWSTLFLGLVVAISLVNIGVTVGAHRLFTHRSYKASTALRVFLLACFTLCGQNCAYIWARDHRQHHKHSDTSADPHDSTRGFFFSHIGWLMVRKHPDVIRAGAHLDMTDLEADKLVMFQKKYYKTLYALLAVGVPMGVTMLLGESLLNAFCVAFMLRYVLSLNGTWLVNSAAHLYGSKPYDSSIVPRENAFVSLVCSGEGWHNYHHAFPWDYKCSELSPRFYNPNARIIEFFARWGHAHDLRSVSDNGVRNRIVKKGDGSHYLWGFGDKDFDRQKEEVVTEFPRLSKEEEEVVEADGGVGNDVGKKMGVARRTVLTSG